ncbi:hypothetical protein TrVFT333_006962 [Trichoderma virens FT-333]|nr:hypothetical protein TrVFT333_006962 [Trichoderma virens FT-333]
MQRLFQRRRQYGVATDEVTGRATPTAPSAPATSARETFPSGIKLLHEPENAIIDIVFVHGLMGDREMTWTAHDTSEPWPKALLPSELPAARVLTFGYDAYVADWRGVVSQNRIANHAWNLLTSLATHRERDESALVTARQRSERHIQDILQSTRGIAFLGTPHHGAGLAKWAERLSKSIGIITQTNSEIIEVLQRESEVLARIQDGFHNMVMARNTEGQPIEISCFFEELPLQGIGQVVPQHSAILPGYIPIGIHGNHMDMTKFASKDDPGFVAVCGELRRWIREISRVGRQNLATRRSAIPEDSPTPTTPLLLIAAMLPNSEELERALRMAPDVNIREDHPRAKCSTYGCDI